MSHMVIYRGPDSKVGYHQTDDIHDAVSFVEQLRNDDGVEHARIFRLEEVNFEYRPYFRVELKAGGPALASAPTPAAAVGVASDSQSTPAAAAAAVASEAPAARDAVVDTPPTPPSTSFSEAASVKVEDKVDEKIEAAEPENGVSARRGLFGR